MIQDIGPYTFNNTYLTRTPEDEDIIVHCQGEHVLMVEKDNTFQLPTCADLRAAGVKPERTGYLFAIGERGFFLAEQLETPEETGWEMRNLSEFRTMELKWMAFGGITATQLYRWESTHRYCGCCGREMQRSSRERSLYCSCGNIVYPKISPAVIVAVTDGDRLLMARNARGAYRRFALVAGFVEVGETFEQTVAREVEEEVGLKVKNIRYYKSQPWSFTDTIMIGFFAELDGADHISIQEEELAEARWFEREAIPESVSDISIAQDMIEAFRHGRHNQQEEKEKLF